KADETALSNQVREMVVRARRDHGRPAGSSVDGGFGDRVRAQVGPRGLPPRQAPAAPTVGQEQLDLGF
ncbi:MAG TPA: hypothetical protein VFP61_13630, partial [Acidimicrobiales bacterium]|nr:hypothetical protein [Acidimicrobiales bacterium]